MDGGKAGLIVAVALILVPILIILVLYLVESLSGFFDSILSSGFWN